MKVLSSPKILFGTLAATGLMAVALNSCSKKEQTPLEKAQSELKAAQDQCNVDSLLYVYSDSIKPKEKLSKLKELKDEYIKVNGNAVNDDVKQMDNKIAEVQAQIDVATGKVFQKSKEKLAKAKEDIKFEGIYNKKMNNEPLTEEENLFYYKVICNMMIDQLNEINKDLEKRGSYIDVFIKQAKKDSIMNVVKNL